MTTLKLVSPLVAEIIGEYVTLSLSAVDQHAERSDSMEKEMLILSLATKNSELCGWLMAFERLITELMAPEMTEDDIQADNAKVRAIVSRVTQEMRAKALEQALGFTLDDM